MSKYYNIEIEKMIVCSFIAIDRSCYNAIDKIFNSNREENLAAMKKVDLKNIRRFIGTIEQEHYYKKMCVIYNEENVATIIKKTYTKINNYVKSNKVVSIIPAVLKQVKDISGISDSQMNCMALGVVVLADKYGAKINENDDIYKNFSNVMQLYNVLVYSNYGDLFDKVTDKDKKLISDILDNLLSKFPKISKSSWLPIESIREDGSIDYTSLSLSEINCIATSKIFDIEMVTINDIIENKFLTRKEAEEMIFLWYMGKILKLDVNELPDDFVVDYEELYTFFTSGVYIKYLLRIYKDNIDYFFKHITNDDTLDLLRKKDKEIARKTNEINDLKRKSENNKNRFEETLEQYKEEIRLLKNKNKQLKNELESYPDIHNELIALRELMFNIGKEQDIKNDSIDIDRINDLCGICFGGLETWTKEMNAILTKWKFIHVDALNFDVNILKGKKYIFINTICNQHGLYYKVIENKDKDAKIRFINSLNKERILNEIYKEL